MTGPRPTRRRLGRLAAGALGALVMPRAVRAQIFPDGGIGGTGVIPVEDREGDRGIGGTGVVGTIRRFGSIVVNDLRIAYDEGTTLAIDGQPAPLTTMRLGHVVRVLAESGDAGLFTRHIAVTSEVIGRIRSVSRSGLTLLGQTVVFDKGLRSRSWRPGTRVAVSGLRRPDGVIVATWIAIAAPGRSHVIGLLNGAGEGRFSVGRLTVETAEPRLVGRCVRITGIERGGRFVAEAVEEDAVDGPDIESYSIETLIERRGNRVRLGSAPPRLADAVKSDPMLEQGLFRAVVTARREGSGTFVVDAVRVTERQGLGRRGSAGRGSPQPSGPGSELSGAPGQPPGRR